MNKVTVAVCDKREKIDFNPHWLRWKFDLDQNGNYTSVMCTNCVDKEVENDIAKEIE